MLIKVFFLNFDRNFPRSHQVIESKRLLPGKGYFLHFLEKVNTVNDPSELRSSTFWGRSLHGRSRYFSQPSYFDWSSFELAAGSQKIFAALARASTQYLEVIVLKSMELSHSIFGQPIFVLRWGFSLFSSNNPSNMRFAEDFKFYFLIIGFSYWGPSITSIDQSFTFLSPKMSKVH